MQTYFDGLDGRECAIIFEEGGYASIRFGNADVRHRVPLTRLRTKAQHEEWQATHPKDKTYMHTVLEVVASVRRAPRPADETDSDWMAYLRANANLVADLRYEDVPKFQEQYNTATGEGNWDPWKRPGLNIRRVGANKYANTLFLSFTGELPAGCPVDVNKEGDGSYTIRNTRFVWELIARDGFRLDP